MYELTSAPNGFGLFELTSAPSGVGLSNESLGTRKQTWSHAVVCKAEVVSPAARCDGLCDFALGGRS